MKLFKLLLIIIGSINLVVNVALAEEDLAIIPSAPAPKDGKWHTKIDFADLEADPQYQISQTELNKLTPEQLNSGDWSQEQIDQLYARLESGPVPGNGFYNGKVIFKSGHGLRGIMQRMDKILGMGKLNLLNNLKASLLEAVSGGLWKGKKVYRDGRRVYLRNAIMDNPKNRILLSLLLSREKNAALSDIPVTDNIGRNFLGGLPLIGKIAGSIGTRAWMLFPAKVYCGQSLYDSRRESVIIDYAYSDDISNYYDPIDSLATRKGLRFRDEIRMVRPGFYLGRAYVQGAFLLNFTLVNDDYKGSTTQSECWKGTQKRGVVAN